MALCGHLTVYETSHFGKRHKKVSGLIQLSSLLQGAPGIASYVGKNGWEHDLNMILSYARHTDPFLAPLFLNKGLCISRRTLVTCKNVRPVNSALGSNYALVPVLRRAMFGSDQDRGCTENRRIRRRLFRDGDVAPTTGYTFCGQMTTWKTIW